MHCMLIAIIKTAIAVAVLNTTFVSSFSTVLLVKGILADTVILMENDHHSASTRLYRNSAIASVSRGDVGGDC